MKKAYVSEDQARTLYNKHEEDVRLMAFARAEAVKGRFGGGWTLEELALNKPTNTPAQKLRDLVSLM